MAAPASRRTRYPNHTGAIWKRPRRVREGIVTRVCSALRSTYGLPRLGNPNDPLDDLIYIILSNRTTPAAAEATFRLLKKRFPVWDDVLRRPPRELTALLRPIGLSQKRSRQIRSALQAIRRGRGDCDLTFLANKRDEEVHAFLTGLPGVSDKVSKCVMMYTLGRHVLPVDTHVHRVSVRLGWIARKRADQSHHELEALVPRDLREAFHITCVAHGRATCRSQRPQCERCVIKWACDYYKSNSGAE